MVDFFNDTVYTNYRIYVCGFIRCGTGTRLYINSKVKDCLAAIFYFLYLLTRLISSW